MCKIVKVLYNLNKQYGVGTQNDSCPYDINRERLDQTNSSTKNERCNHLDEREIDKTRGNDRSSVKS